MKDRYVKFERIEKSMKKGFSLSVEEKEEMNNLIEKANKGFELDEGEISLLTFYIMSNKWDSATEEEKELRDKALTYCSRNGLAIPGGVKNV